MNAVDAENVKSARAVAENEAMAVLAEALKSRNRLSVILATGLVIVSLLAGYGYFRRPKVLVAVQTPDGQRIASIDDINFGGTEQIQMGEDNLTNGDKEYLVSEFLKRFFAVDMASRGKDVERALSFMSPNSAASYYKMLNEQGFLQRERDEAWSASWKTDSFEIDGANKNRAVVIGTQELRRMIGGKPKKEKVQYKISFDLHTDGKREGSPLRSGYWIVNFKADEISRNEEA
jgi:hypothetical protein